MIAVVDTGDQLRRWLVNTADEHGAAVLHVAEDERGASYAFSVGAWRRFGKPEVVAIGLPKDVAHTVVNTYVRRAADGERFVPGGLYQGFLEGCPVTVEQVAREYYAEFFGSAFAVYRDGNFPALQLIAATPEGKFPWHADAPKGFAQYQPVLTTSGAPESWVPGQNGP